MSLLLLALALSADVFAVALSRGVSLRPGRTASAALSVGLALGAAQGLMPLLGWSLNAALATVIRDVDHWVAFVLLVVIALHMMREGRSSTSPEVSERSGNASLLVVALATSIDAAAAGATLPALQQSIPVACAMLGTVGFAFAVTGVFAGRAAGNTLGPRAQFIGGLVLVALAIKIVMEHEGLMG